MSDRFDQNERHCARAYAILQKRNGRAKHAEPDDSDLMEEDAADQAEAQNVVSGKPVCNNIIEQFWMLGLLTTRPNGKKSLALTANLDDLVRLQPGP